MRKQQYEEYTKIKDEVDNLKGFLFWCGKKYRSCGSHFPTRVIGRKVRISVGRKSIGVISATEISLPAELQEAIIDVIEKYVEQREKDMEAI